MLRGDGTVSFVPQETVVYTTTGLSPTTARSMAASGLSGSEASGFHVRESPDQRNRRARSVPHTQVLR